MFLTHETDPMLRRYERNQAISTLVMAAAAALWGLDFALGVLGGGLLMTISYRGIRSGVEAIVASPRETAASLSLGAKRRAALLARFVGRYALLALAAYVMLTGLRTHPAGLLIGASSPAVAAGIEAVRVVRAWSRPGHSR